MRTTLSRRSGISILRPSRPTQAEFSFPRINVAGSPGRPVWLAPHQCDAASRNLHRGSPHNGNRCMNARDLMSSDVVSVAPATPLREVAKTLVRHGISAVPVVDDSGTLVGMVSEGDLVGRKKTERESRSEWWLMRLAEGEPLAGQFLDHLQSPLAVAREVMSSPVVTVDEGTHLDEIASLMATHRVKRLPVVRDGRIVGLMRS